MTVVRPIDNYSISHFLIEEASTIDNLITNKQAHIHMMRHEKKHYENVSCSVVSSMELWRLFVSERRIIVSSTGPVLSIHHHQQQILWKILHICKLLNRELLLLLLIITHVISIACFKYTPILYMSFFFKYCICFYFIIAGFMKLRWGTTIRSNNA